MPLCIASVALLGWAFGLAPAAALLLGAVLAPTDPVLASDVQVAGPTTGDEDAEEDDDVRFSLTSEAGLNDGLAFPFVMAAVLLATEGSVSGWALEWVACTLVGKVVVGVLVGVGVGWALARVAFRSRRDALRVAERGESLLAIAALVTAYGARGAGRRLRVPVGLRLRDGVPVGRAGPRLPRSDARGRRAPRAAAHAVHPAGDRHRPDPRAARRTGLAGRCRRAGADPRDPPARGCDLVDAVATRRGTARRAVPARTLGDVVLRRPRRRLIYYLAFAAGESSVLAEDWLWSTVAFTVVASVLVHGVLSRPVMRAVEEDNARRA